MIDPRDFAACPVCGADWLRPASPLRFNVAVADRGGWRCPDCDSCFYQGGDADLFRAKAVQFHRLRKRRGSLRADLGAREPTTVDGAAMLFQQAMACAHLTECDSCWLACRGRATEARALEAFAHAVRRPVHPRPSSPASHLGTGTATSGPGPQIQAMRGPA